MMGKNREVVEALRMIVNERPHFYKDLIDRVFNETGFDLKMNKEEVELDYLEI